MSSPVSPTPSRALSTFMGIFAAFASFAVLAVILQYFIGGHPDDAAHAERVKRKTDVAAEQDAIVEKYGLIAGNSTQAIDKALEAVKTRKVSTTTQVVPGSPTAIKAAAAAPAPEAPAPAAAAPAAPAPAPAAVAPAAPAPTPAQAAPAEPAPAAPAPAPAPQPQQ